MSLALGIRGKNRNSIPALEETLGLWPMWRDVERIKDQLVVGGGEERGNEPQVLGLGRGRDDGAIFWAKESQVTRGEESFKNVELWRIQMEIASKELDIRGWSLREMSGWKYRVYESKAMLVVLGAGETNQLG